MLCGRGLERNLHILLLFHLHMLTHSCSTMDMSTPANLGTKGCGVPGSRKLRKKRKFSSTKGRDKSDTCKADKNKRFFAKRSRSYRDPEYPTYLAMMQRQRKEAKSSDIK